MNDFQKELLAAWPSNEGCVESDVEQTEMTPSAETLQVLKEHADLTLYRIFPLVRFYELIEKHEMSFVHVSNWEDTNEAYRYLVGLEADEFPGHIRNSVLLFLHTTIGVSTRTVALRRHMLRSSLIFNGC